MAKEIERKFLVTRPGVVDGLKGERLEQGYLVNEPMTVRVRIADDRAYLTLKSRSRGIERDEFEYPIPLADAREMLDKHCIAGPLKKTRYRIPHGDLVIEVDVFDGPLTGLVVAEIELVSEDQPFEKLDWFGLEVSTDPRYANSNLAMAAAPPIT